MLLMFQNFQHTRRNLGIASLMYLLLGVLLLVWPGQFIQIACYVIGALMIAFCVITVLGELRRKNMNIITVMISIMIAAIGIVIIANPALVSSIIPVTFGLVLLVDGVINIRHAIGMKRYKERTWGPMLVMGLITLVLGVFILVHPYGTAQLAFRVLGAALIYNGISDIFILYNVNRASKKYIDKDGAHDIIDVDTRPVDDDDDT